MNDYELLEKIENIIESNIIHIPYEGDDIDKGSLKASVFDLIK